MVKLGYKKRLLVININIAYYFNMLYFIKENWSYQNFYGIKVIMRGERIEYVSYVFSCSYTYNNSNYRFRSS